MGILFKSAKRAEKIIDTVDRYAFYTVVCGMLVVGIAGASIMSAVEKALEKA